MIISNNFSVSKGSSDKVVKTITWIAITIIT